MSNNREHVFPPIHRNNPALYISEQKRRAVKLGNSGAIRKVALALVQRDLRWLVAKRKPDVHLGGFWEFPGGQIEAGESTQDAAIRELREECAVDARPVSVVRPVHWQFKERTVDLYPVFCDWVAGEGTPLECAECRWVSRAELEQLRMPDSNVEILAALDSFCVSRGPNSDPDRE